MRLSYPQLAEKYGQNSVRDFIKDRSTLRWFPYEVDFLKDILKYCCRFYLYTVLAVVFVMVPSFIFHWTSSFSFSVLISISYFFITQKAVEIYYNLEDWVKVKFITITQSEKESAFVDWWCNQEIEKLLSEERLLHQSIRDLQKFIINQYEILSNDSVPDYDKEDLYEIALEKQNKIDLLNYRLEQIKVAKLSLNNYSLSIKEQTIPEKFPTGIDHHGIYLEHTKTEYEFNKLHQLEEQEHDISAISFKNSRT